ncbi:MAG: VTT domain-containing protein [Pseudomonadota bacterium]
MNELQAALDWLARYPAISVALLFLFCALESLIVLGSLIPTTLVLFAAGAAVTFGLYEFWQMTAVATLGAMSGDYFNFWIGRHYGERMLQSKWALRYPEAIRRARSLMQRNGTQGLLIGRYVGLIRPFVGALAGAQRMPPWKFLLIELASCLSWAVGLIVLGVMFSASLALATEVAARLAVLMVLLIVLVWVGFALSRRVIGTAQGHAEDWLHRLLDWSHRHRRLGRLGEALADPDQPETPGLLIVAGLLLLLGAAWLTLWWGLGWREYPPALDAFIYQSLQDLHTPWATAAAVAIAQLGEWPVYGPVALATLIALAWKSRDRAVAHWIAAVAFGGVISLGLFALPTFNTPLEFYHGELSAHFSGRELVLATIIYGFMPVLLATRRHTAVRIRFYGTATALLLLILLAELYLGAQWFSMALYAMISGLIWVAALGLGYRRHRAERVAAAHFVPLVLGAFVIAAAAHWSAGYQPRAQAAQPKWRLETLSLQQWLTHDYEKLPAQRVDMAGRQKTVFDIQWAGDLRAIENALVIQGWSWPYRLSLPNMLRWLATDAPIGELPVLPQVHEGRHQALMLKRDLDDQSQYLLQLWPSTYQLQKDRRIWVGHLAVQRSKIQFGLLHYPLTTADAPPLETLLDVAEFRREQRTAADGRKLWLLHD